jgi:hypothetical protein
MRLAQRFASVCLAASCSLGSARSFDPVFASDKTKTRGPTLPLYITINSLRVVRQKLPLDLRAGVNHVQVTDITAHLEPDSVILRSLDTGRSSSDPRAKLPQRSRLSAAAPFPL